MQWLASTQKQTTIFWRMTSPNDLGAIRLSAKICINKMVGPISKFIATSYKLKGGTPENMWSFFCNKMIAGVTLPNLPRAFKNERKLNLVEPSGAFLLGVDPIFWSSANGRCGSRTHLDVWERVVVLCQNGPAGAWETRTWEHLSGGFSSIPIIWGNYTNSLSWNKAILGKFT